MSKDPGGGGGENQQFIFFLNQHRCILNTGKKLNCVKKRPRPEKRKGKVGKKKGIRSAKMDRGGIGKPVKTNEPQPMRFV